MKVLFVIDSMVGGGAQRQLVNVAVGFKARKHHVSVFTYCRNEWHLPRLIAAGIDYECHEKTYRFSLRPPIDLYRKYRDFKPQVVVAFLRTPAVYAEALRPIAVKTPLIVSERAGVEGGGLKRTDILAGLGHLLASHVTANSHDYLDRLKRVIPLEGRSTVIYNGLEEEFLANGTTLLALGPKPVGNRWCVVAARVTAQKGPMPLVNALARLRQVRSDFHLDWIGPVDDTYPLVRQIKQALVDHGLHSHWTWVGLRKDMTQVYKNYDALILPSVNEGVANTMCEAMASGVPVIATDIGDNPRIIRDGVDGFLCAAGDSGGLADAMLRFMSLDAGSRHALACSAAQRAEHLFSFDRLVDQWELLCASLCATRSIPRRARS